MLVLVMNILNPSLKLHFIYGNTTSSSLAISCIFINSDMLLCKSMDNALFNSFQAADINRIGYRDARLFELHIEELPCC